MIFVHISRWLLLLSLLFPGFATADTSWELLAEDLQQRHRETPESLNWYLPNKSDPTPYDQVGFKSDRCEPPIPSRQTPVPRFLVRCITPALSARGFITIRTVTSWPYVDNDWGTGQIIATYVSDKPPTNPYAYQRETYRDIWHSGDLVGSYQRAVAMLSETEADQLRAFWRSIPELTAETRETLEEWKQLPWPDGVVGIRRNGQLLLQRGSLAGTGALLEKLNEPNAVPTFTQGLIRAIDEQPRSWSATRSPGPPMFMVYVLESNDGPHAIALSEPAPDGQFPGIQVLSSDEHQDIVFIPLERNL